MTLHQLTPKELQRTAETSKLRNTEPMDIPQTRPTPSAADALREAFPNIETATVFFTGDGRHAVLFSEFQAVSNALATALAGHASRDGEIAGLKGDVQNLRIAVDQVKDKAKETAKDFETAFRLVRQVNDTLRAEVEKLTKERDECVERIRAEEARADGAGNRLAKERAEADCKRIRLERDTLSTQLAEAKTEVDSIIDTGHRYGHAGDTAMAVYLSATNEIDDKAEEIRALETSLTSAQTIAGELAGAFGFIESETLTLECYDSPSPGGDDGEVYWRVIEYHMAAPRQRYIGYGNTPLKAIADARRYRAQQRSTAQEAE